MEDKKHSFMDQLNLFFIGLVTIDNCVFRIVRELCSEDCLICWYRNCNIYMFCNELPINLYLKPI